MDAREKSNRYFLDVELLGEECDLERDCGGMLEKELERVRASSTSDAKRALRAKVSQHELQLVFGAHRGEVA